MEDLFCTGPFRSFGSSTFIRGMTGPRRHPLSSHHGMDDVVRSFRGQSRGLGVEVRLYVLIPRGSDVRDPWVPPTVVLSPSDTGTYPFVMWS